MLGDQKQAFDIIQLRKRLDTAKTFDETIAAKQYVISYFAHCLTPKGILMWDPTVNGFIHFKDKEAKHILNECVTLVSQESNRKQKDYIFNIWNWFQFDYKYFYKLDVDPTKPRVYEDKLKQKYINRFPGFLYPNPLPYNTFSNEVTTHVKTILDHIKNVLCSNKPDQVKYMFGWLSNMISGRKMKTAIFLHSGQGTGKSIITSFIRENVLGRKITHKTANEKAITGSFNKELEGKVLLILEEMSGSKTGDWLAFASRLKDFIDSEELIIEEKGKTPYPVTNIISLIINSNNSKAVKLDSDDRRYFIPDISDQYIGNKEYFKTLGNAMNHPKVGEAFYSLMLKFATQPFNETVIPIAETKQMMLNEAIHSVHIFIKEQYLIAKSNETDLNRSSSELYDNYKEWFKEHANNRRSCGIQEFSKKMREIGLVAKQIQTNGSRKMRYQSTREELYNVYKKKGWIDELENISKHKQVHTDLFDETNMTKSIVKWQDAQSKQQDSHITKQVTKTSKDPPKVPPKPKHLKTKSVIEWQDVQTEEQSCKEKAELSNKTPNKTPIQQDIQQDILQQEERPDMYYGKVLETLYKDVKENWISHEYDSDDFNWDCFIAEIENMKELALEPRHKFNKYKNSLEKIINHCRITISGRDTKIIFYDQYPTYTCLIKMLNSYGRVRETQFITPPEGFDTILVHPSMVERQNSQSDNNSEEWNDEWEEGDAMLLNN